VVCPVSRLCGLETWVVLTLSYLILNLDLRQKISALSTSGVALGSELRRLGHGLCTNFLF
jgi:hypothetical protein